MKRIEKFLAIFRKNYLNYKFSIITTNLHLKNHIILFYLEKNCKSKISTFFSKIDNSFLENSYLLINTTNSFAINK